MQLGQRLPEFDDQMRIIEKNIEKGKNDLETAHKGNRSSYTTDPTENRKLRIQQKSLQAFDNVER